MLVVRFWFVCLKCRWISPWPCTWANVSPLRYAQAHLSFGSVHLAQCTRTRLHKCVSTLRYPPAFPRQIFAVPFILTTARSWMKNRRRWRGQRVGTFSNTCWDSPEPNASLCQGTWKALPTSCLTALNWTRGGEMTMSSSEQWSTESQVGGIGDNHTMSVTFWETAMRKPKSQAERRQIRQIKIWHIAEYLLMKNEFLLTFLLSFCITHF